jgi:F-type H+-transporting ATPase subunit gamma
MSDSLAALRRQIRNTEDLRSVVKTMKAMAAASITQFERAVESLRDYHQTVERALAVCVRQAPLHAASPSPAGTAGMIVLGTDQGMAGQFNEHVVEAALGRLAETKENTRLWVIGERAQSRLENAGQTVTKVFPTPQSAEAITQLISDLLLEIETAFLSGEAGAIDLCHNTPVNRANYETRWTSLLPLDQSWRESLRDLPWPTNQLPEIIRCDSQTWASLVSEFLFVSLFQAVAESCSAENAARLAAMQRAEKNIDDRRRDLDLSYNRQRQSTIDEELFDLISGFEALS